MNLRVLTLNIPIFLPALTWRVLARLMVITWRKYSGASAFNCTLFDSFYCLHNDNINFSSNLTRLACARERERERERQRETETERQRDRETERHRETERQRDRQRDRETETETE